MPAKLVGCLTATLVDRLTTKFANRLTAKLVNPLTAKLVDRLTAKLVVVNLVKLHLTKLHLRLLAALQGFCLTVARSPGVPCLRAQATKFLNEEPEQVPNLSQGDSSPLSPKFDPSWRLSDEKSDMVGESVQYHLKVSYHPRI